MKPSTVLKREDFVALYVQIADHIAREIVEGKRSPLERLPSEQELVAQFGVSRVTVRQAIMHLLRQGLVVRKQGKGTFVAGSVVRHELQTLKGFYDTLVMQGLHPDTRLLEFAPRPLPPHLVPVFGPDERPYYFLRRLYSLDGRPIALACGYLPPETSRVTWEQVKQHPIYSVLEKFLGLRIARADVRIRAQQAGSDIGPELNLGPRKPLLVMERVSFCTAGKPREHTTFYIQPETYEFALGVRGPLSISSAIKEVATG